MKYDNDLLNLKTQLPNINNVVVALSQNPTVDQLAAGLSLSLALKNIGKQVSIISNGNLLVSHSNLYGVGDIKDQFPQIGSGNYILTLAGVVDQNGLVPALERLDWYPEGQNLNLVFHINPNQKFEPTEIAARYDNAGINLFVLIGCTNLSDLGPIYQQNADKFSQAPIVNIDNNISNAKFGWTNVIDVQAASVSEMMVTILSSLGLLIDADIASNILAGIYNATNNLTSKVNSDTFMAAALAMQSGGKLPPIAAQTSSMPVVEPQAQPFVQMPQSPPPSATGPTSEPVNPTPSGFDLSKIFGIPPTALGTEQPLQTDPSTPQIDNPQQVPRQSQSVDQSLSHEEVPTGEVVSSTEAETQNPAPDWLVPKVFKGGSLG